MPTPPADSENEPAELHSIRCPYCDQEVDISLRTAEGTRLPVEKAELKALPYARDVEIFDQDPHAEGKTNSQWTKIGEDFFGGLNYESIGILHMEKGWQVRYCVARCPQCARLIDVFANLTPEKTLAAMWPHLLGKSPNSNSIKPWRPKGTFSTWSEDTFFVLLFFLVIGVGSLLPDLMPYFRQPVFDSDRFRIVTAPIFWLRGTMIVSLFLLLSLRKKLIGVFRNEVALSRLFAIQTGLAYWSNFAVSRFTGYQRENKLFTFNAVMVLGGFSSVIIFIATWMIVQLWMAPAPAPGLYATAAGLVFWLIIAYLFGIVVWNFSVVPVYVFRGIRNIPMRMDTDGEFREFRLIQRAAGYTVAGLVILIGSAIALSLFPIFAAPFAELRVAIIWAQVALIVCFSVLIIRFEIKPANDRIGERKGMLKIILILMSYIAMRYGIGIAQADGWVIQTIGWLGIVETGAAKKYAELVVFSFLAAQYNIFRPYDDELMEAVKRKDYALQGRRCTRPPRMRRKPRGSYNGSLP